MSKDITNNPGNGYFAVLPRDVEGERVLEYLRAHLSPDRKIRARGQGPGVSGRKYKYGTPLQDAPGMRLYLEYVDPRNNPEEVRRMRRAARYVKNRTAIRLIRSTLTSLLAMIDKTLAEY